MTGQTELASVDRLEAGSAERTTELSDANATIRVELAGRLRAEQGFRQQAQLLDLARDTIMVLDLQGRITFWNKGAEQTYGWTRDEALGQVSYELLKTRFPASFEVHEAELARQGYWEADLIHRRRDGAPVVAASRWVLQRDERNEPQAILEIHNDITQRKRTEEALKESEERYRVLVELSPHMVWMAGADGSVVFVNQYGLDYTGLTTDEVQGYGWAEAVRPDHRERVLATWHRSVCAGDCYQDEFPIRRAADGVYHWHVVRGLPIRDDAGKIAKWNWAAIDIDDRKRAEEALQDREARLRAIVDNAVDGIITIDEHGLIDSFNPAAERLFGYRAEEVIGYNVSLLMASPDREEHDNHMARYRRTNEKKIIGAGREVLGQRKDGSTFPHELAVSEMTVGGRCMFTGILRDISGRKQTEALLAHRAEELARSNGELEHFAYIASHDLQEPLRMVSVFTGRLAQRYQGQLDEKADQYIELAVDGCKRMQRLIEDLLRYSRVTTKGGQPVPVDSGTVLAGTLNDLRAAIAEAGAEITHDSMPIVAADATQLGQLFQNLIGNALKFHSAEPPHVHISARRDHEWCTFAVADNGIGIDPQYYDRIFTVFQRLHTAEEYPGTGIGLSICKKIVERQGGRICVESKPGRGSTFSFTLPTVPDGAHP